MKKTILKSIIAFTAIVAMSFAASAQTDATTGATEQTQKESKEVRRHRPERKLVNAFEGIELTDAQKESLKALHPQRPEGKGKQVKDSVAGRPDGKKMRADYVNGVKAILTPDQYVVFLENIVLNDAFIPGGANRPAMHQGMRKGGDKQHGKDRKPRDVKAKKGGKERK